MLISVSVIVLASQLVIAVADDMPQFDIARSCKIDSTAAIDPNAGMNGTVKRCMNDEQNAKDQLQTQWVGFVDGDRVNCTGSTIAGTSGAPSYVDLLTCLQDAQLVRKLPKN
jgi:hypothetical protein